MKDGHKTASQLFCRDIHEWRVWLKTNHAKETSIWLVYLKGETQTQKLTYEESLDEALCFGWIDSLIRRVDEERYARKFSIRRTNSKWSESNKRRVAELIKAGRMAPSGLKIVAAAKANGSWHRPDRPPLVKDIPVALMKAFSTNKKAKTCFEELAPSHRTRYIMWITTAKKQETIERRVKEAIRMLESKKELGLK